MPMKNAMKVLTMSLAAAVVASLATSARADPLDGQILKFQQKPLDNLALTDGVFTMGPYWGHDELSTASNILPGGTANAEYQGQYMADDFADRDEREVVHVKWWGSYLDGVGEPTNPPFGGVQKFLISFEKDVPATTGEDGSAIPSHPGGPILSQVVTRDALFPGSGTFTEKWAPGHPVAAAPETLFEYNAELHCPFPQQPDTVYWLKIVALVDEAKEGDMIWGWHNRDYTERDLLASVPPPLPPPPLPGVTPGERPVGLLPTGQRIWHFQDDAVTGSIENIFVDSADPCAVNFVQPDWAKTHYVNGLDGPGPIAGTPFPGIEIFSKDLAFELYAVPEPSTVVMLVCGGLCLLSCAWRRRRTR